MVTSSYGLSVTDESISKIALNCPDLRMLNVEFCESLTDASLGLIATHCTKLEVVRFMENTVSYFTVCALMANCKHIEEIHAPELVGASDAVDSVVSGNAYKSFDGIVCPNLHTVDIRESGSRAKNDLFLCIADHAPNLTKLNIESCGGSIKEPAFINLVTKCHKLTSLEMGGCFGLTSQCMDAIILNLADIDVLDIEDCNIATIASVKKLLATCSDLTLLKWSFYTKNEPKAALKALQEQYPEVEMTCSRGS